MLSVKRDSDDQLFAYIDNKQIYLKKIRDNEQLINYEYKKVNHDGADYYILKIEMSSYYNKFLTFVIKSSDALSCVLLCDQDLYNANIRFVCKGTILLLEDDNVISGTSIANKKIDRTFFHEKQYCKVYLSDNFILFIKIDDETSGELFSYDGKTNYVILTYYDNNIIISEADSNYERSDYPFYIVNVRNDYLKIKYARMAKYPYPPYSINITSVLDTTFICLHNFSKCLLFHEINNKFICYEKCSFEQYDGLYIALSKRSHKLIIYNSFEYKMLPIAESIFDAIIHDGIVSVYRKEDYWIAYGLQICNIDNKIVITYIPSNDTNFNDIVLLKSMIKCLHNMSDDEGFKEAYKLLSTFGGLMCSKYILE